MSIHLMSLVWRVRFPSQTQKLLMMRIADFAHEDGTGIYPAIDTMASEIGASRRQTQYALKALESCDLIRRVRAGGKGSKCTNAWQINNELLVQLALQEVTLNGAHDCLEVVENEGAIIAPRDLLRVQLTASRVQSATDKGATSCTQTTKNHHLEPSDARERARDSSRASRARVAIRLTPQVDPVQFGHWLDRMAECNRDDLVTAARDTGHIIVATRWPPAEGLRGLISAGSVDVTERMMGEADA